MEQGGIQRGGGNERGPREGEEVVRGHQGRKGEKTGGSEKNKGVRASKYQE